MYYSLPSVNQTSDGAYDKTNTPLQLLMDALTACTDHHR
jgi:hypothetical protein